MKMARLLLRLVLVLLLLAGLSLVAIYGYLRSAGGMERLEREISTRASSDEMRLTLSGLQGNLFSDLHIKTLTLADRKGIWLTVQDTHVQWSPAALMGGAPPLQTLAVGNIDLTRLPESEAPAAPQTQPKNSSESLADYATYFPQNLALEHVRVAQAVAGIEQRLSLHGQGDAQHYTLRAQNAEGVPLRLEGVIQAARDKTHATLNFQEAEGGLVAALLKLPNTTALALDADLTLLQDGDFIIHSAKASAGTLHGEAQGTYSLAENLVDVALTLSAPDMNVLQAALQTPMNGDAQLSLTAKGTAEQLHIVLEGKSTHLLVQQDRLDQLTLRGDATLNPVAWGKPGFHAQGKMEASGTHNLKPFSVVVSGGGKDGHLSLPSLAADYGDNQLRGSAEAEGTLQTFNLKSETTLKAGDSVAHLLLDGKVDSEHSRYAGDAKGTLTHSERRFDFATTLDAKAEQARLSGLSLKGPGISVEGDATFFLKELLADATLSFQMKDLAPLAEALGTELAGSLTGDATLKRNGEKQQVKLAATASALALPGIRVQSATVNAKAEDAIALEGIDMRLSASGTKAEELTVSKLEATLSGGTRQGVFVALQGDGSHQSKPWTLNLKGKGAQPSPSNYRIELATLNGSYDKSPIILAAPSTLLYAPEATSSLSPLTLQLAGGSVRAEGTLQKTRLNGTLAVNLPDLQKLPVASLPQASLETTADISGTATAPRINWKAKSNLSLDGTKVSATVAGDWKDQRLQTNVTLQSEKAHADAKVTLPARLSLQPFETDISAATALKGDVTTSIPLGLLNPRLRPEGHRLGGTLAGKATLAGTLGNPYFDGNFSLSQGRYDHDETGICLRDITARLSGNQRAVRLEQFSATDSDKHRFTARAALTLSGTPTVSGDARFDQFKLFCGGMMNGNIDGNLTAAGTTSAMNIHGKLALGPLNVQIPGARATSTIPDVPLQWVKRSGQKAESTTPGSVALDILIVADKQLFIRGRGLDAEFAGKLAITGTANAPQLAGQFDKRRGTFTLLDRVLSLDTATVKFEGPIPPSPFLTVDASTTVNTHTINVSLAGTAAKPKLTLSSTPTLPQDEVLALLLFGRQLDHISAFEAIQLARATQTLAGLGDDGPGVIGTIRDTLGLDRLEMGADSSSNVNVSTGKYVTDRVYVGVTQGVKPEDRSVVTEITLTPSLIGKTSMDSVGNQSVGAEWKRDY